MKIIALTTFLDGRDRFTKDDRVTVDDERGERFIKNGWAAPDDGTSAPAVAPAAETTLNIHDSEIGHG